MKSLGSTCAASGSSLISRGYAKTLPAADNGSSTRPMTKRQRVSSHERYQSMSVLLDNGFEKDFFECHRHDIDGDGIERARLQNDLLAATGRERRQHAPPSARARDTRGAKGVLGRRAIEDGLDAAVTGAQFVELAFDDRAAALDDHDAIGD